VSSLAGQTGQRTDKKDELRLLVNSRQPIIAVETSEEQCVEELLAEVASELGVPFFVWSITTGLARQGAAQPIYHTDDPEQALANIALIRGDALFLLKDFARYLDQDRVLRRFRELGEGFRGARRSIVLSGASLELPPELDDDAAPLRLELPDAGILLQVVLGTLSDLGRDTRFKVELDSNGLRQLAQNLSGLTREEARHTLTKCLLASGRADAKTLANVLEAKRTALRQEGVLEYLRADASFADIADLKTLKMWLEKRRGALTAEGKKFGLEPPKGILITGVQGCGKSLSAKAVAGEWSIELAKLDAGALYDKYIGESEKRLRRSLEVAEKLSPVVLWIDEIEKGFAASGASADVDAGLSQRLLATFLTWLQDRQTGVFVAATSNNIAALPPELLRKGRFDEIFFVDLPDADSRAELFRIHLARRGRDPAQFGLPKLAAACEGFSGAEIEQAVISGLYSAFSQKQQLSTDILFAELRSTRPLSVTRHEDVAALRAWALDRAVRAN
jgi:SpoVK/Ycf46/Vps4 family AAA+-type ATPase